MDLKRSALGGALIESLDLEVDEAGDVEAAWSAGIARRLERVDAGVAKTIRLSRFGTTSSWPLPTAIVDACVAMAKLHSGG